MQKLYFEPAWDKTIAAIDREQIMKSFREIEMRQDIHLSFLWTAVNHKNEQLVTVLIHNPEDEPLEFKQIAIGFQKDSKPVETALFTVPLKIPSKTSMPWTFIFSDENQTTESPVYIIHQE